MFAHEVLETKNTKEQLPPGIYEGTCSLYTDAKTKIHCLLMEYGIKASDTVTVAEIIITNEQEEHFFRDFMKMPDDSWRDSYGRRADTLVELLPQEIMSFNLVERFPLEEQMVGDRG